MGGPDATLPGWDAPQRSRPRSTARGELMHGATERTLAQPRASEEQGGWTVVGASARGTRTSARRKPHPAADASEPCCAPAYDVARCSLEPPRPPGKAAVEQASVARHATLTVSRAARAPVTPRSAYASAQSVIGRSPGGSGGGDRRLCFHCCCAPARCLGAPTCRATPDARPGVCVSVCTGTLSACTRSRASATAPGQWCAN